MERIWTSESDCAHIPVFYFLRHLGKSSNLSEPQCACVHSGSVMFNSSWRHGLYSLPGSSFHWIFFKQEHWSRLPFPPPGDLPDPGIEPVSPASPALQADCFTAESSGKPRASVHSSTKWSHNKLVGLCWGFKKTPLFFSRRLTLCPMRTNNSYPIGALIMLCYIISPTIV